MIKGEPLPLLVPAVPPPDPFRSASGTGAAPVKSIPLERLPLPSFKGTKMEYLRFKQDFRKHVKYETKGEKMLALKTKCLTKSADKQRIANTGCFILFYVISDI